MVFVRDPLPTYSILALNKCKIISRNCKTKQTKPLPPPPIKWMSNSAFSHSILSVSDQNEYEVKVSSAADTSHYYSLEGFQKEKESLKIDIFLSLFFYFIFLSERMLSFHFRRLSGDAGGVVLNSFGIAWYAPTAFEASLLSTLLTEEIRNGFVELLPACSCFFTSHVKHSAAGLWKQQKVNIDQSSDPLTGNSQTLLPTGNTHGL